MERVQTVAERSPRNRISLMHLHVHAAEHNSDGNPVLAVANPEIIGEGDDLINKSCSRPKGRR